jgi:hypothetical protein
MFLFSFVFIMLQCHAPQAPGMNQMSSEQKAIMDNSKGSLILKALSPSADEAQLIAYLEKRAKSIPAESIPALLRNLPVVLSRNVTEDTGLLVIHKLQELGAEVLFVPIQDSDAGDMSMATPSTPIDGTGLEQQARQAGQRKQSPFVRSLRQISKEFWIILSMLGIAWMLNYTIASQYLLLGLYTLPAVLSAYYFGRRQSVLTAFASILLVALVSFFNPGRFDRFNLAGLGGDNQWYHIISWGCILLVTAYTMGTLYEKNKNKMQELRQTYQGLLLILRHFITQDEERENHCFRVSIYATRIASYMGLEKDDIEDIRSAALLHDLGKLKISRGILHKAARLIREEPSATGNAKPDEHLLCGPMGRILPMLLEHHEQVEHLPSQDKEAIPKGAHILAVADAFDTMTTAGTGRDALSPEEAKEKIKAGAGVEFDPEVVRAFTVAFDRMEMELPDIIL